MLLISFILLLMASTMATMASLSPMVTMAQDNITCHINGKCDGIVVGRTVENDYNNCLNTCKANINCNWFTFFDDLNDCLQYSECPSILEDTNCYTGQKQCEPGTLFLGKLLIVSGRGAEYRVELVDLSEGGENRICPPMLDYPGADEATVGTYINDRAMVCGGFKFGSTRTCYYYNKSTKLWIQTISMQQNRDYATGVQLSPTEWWITGGYNSGHNSTEVYKTNNNSFSSYTDLPEEKSSHNLVQINATHFMLLGGYHPLSNKTWMFDKSTQVWSPMPDLLEARAQTHAGLVKYPDGRQAVVVAGGDDTLTSEIFDLEEQIWKYGPDLPASSELCCGASVQYKDSFLIVGGYKEEYYSDTIFTLDPLTENWVELPQKLKMGRFHFTAFLVPDDFAKCT